MTIAFHEILMTNPGRLEALPQIAQPLLDWYDINARSLPWRDDPAPYRVWVSEIMLQQTRVEAVKGYFYRFLEALPDIPSLAGADEALLLKLWEGLGYYNRVRNLQKAAKVVMRDFGGSLPASYDALLTLPGIGEYTAGAIASIAFGIPVPAVDGNVLRVFSRISASGADIAHPSVKESWRKIIPGVQPPGRPGDFNQALMELGATVCLPNGQPLCRQCPVRKYCCAFADGVVDVLPIKQPKKARRIEHRTLLWVLCKGKVLLFQRGETGLLANMWEPVNLMEDLTVLQAKQEIEKLGGQVVKCIPLRNSKHLFTHIEWHMKAYLLYTDSFDVKNGRWADREVLADELALPSAFRAYTKDLPHLLADCEE